MNDVKLGYEVGTGEEVRIPIAHMVVCGQTQQSGKTTTLEALVSRADGMRALVFRTKRGEGAFERGRRVAPFFRQRADWQYVEAILESTMRQRMKFERAWIVKACRGTRTLRDVRANLTKLQAKATRSMDQDLFMLLGEYLDQVLPVLDKLPAAPGAPNGGIAIGSGLNVVDLIGLPVEVQGLVIGSMLQWVHEHEVNVTVVVPESWKYVPQGRNSPVKMAAVSIAREGAGLRNFLWLDSQDIAGVEKELIRGATVWLLGVQREVNEVKRALAHIPAGIKKPRAEAVATLGKGEFFACFGTRVVRTYVQPVWLKDSDAVEVARGERVVVPVLRDEVKFSEPLMPAFRGRIELLEEDEMPKEIEAKLDAIEESLRKMSATIVSRLEEVASVPAATVEGNGSGNALPVLTGSAVDIESIYEHVRTRLLEDAPVLARVLARLPQLEVHVETVTVTVDGATLRGRIARLLAEGFFDDAKTGKDLVRELERRGGNMSDRTNYGRELGWLTESGFLTKDSHGWQVVEGAKVNVVRK